MRFWMDKRWSGEWAPYFKFMSTLLLIVAGVFVYFSITACGEGGGGGCGGSSAPYSPPAESPSSDITTNKSVDTPPYSLSTLGTGDQSRSDGAIKPGSTVTRYINYTAEEGYDPTSIEWTPPEGASEFTFSLEAAHPVDPGPYIFNTYFPIDLPIRITYKAPPLPSGWTSYVVGEVFKASRGDFADDIRVLTYTISASADAAAEAPQPPPAGPRIVDKVSATVSSTLVERWYGVEDTTLTTTLCQQIFDWLQSDGTFIAMRMPVDTSGGSYDLPVLFPPADNTPKAEMQVDASSIQDFSLVVRGNQIPFMENNLPSAAGEHWVALGLDTATPATCPTGLNTSAWEFYFRFPTNPATPIDSMPLYYCQEGQDAPPVGNAVMRLLAGDKGKRAQADGVTCLGPYNQNLNTNPTLVVSHPHTVWDAYTGDEIRLMHTVQQLGTVPAVKFSITSDVDGFGWKLYPGTDTAPNLSAEIDMSQPYTLPTSFEAFWMIGTVPAGVSAGSHTVNFRAEKSDDSGISGVSTDLIWTGDWVAPPPGPTVGNLSGKFLPLIKK